MALAILEFIAFEKKGARFRVDTGTNPFYRIKVGKSFAETNGLKWIDEVGHSTPLHHEDRGDYLLNTSKEILIPSSYFDRDNCYAQLFSYKNAEGKSPAFSRMVKVPVGLKNTIGIDYLLSLSLINAEAMTGDTTSSDMNFKDCRFVDMSKNNGNYSSPQSLDILNIIKTLAPVVQDLLAGAQNGSGKVNGEANPLTKLLPAGSWNTILNVLLHGLPALTGTTPTSTPDAKPATGNDASKSGAKSLSLSVNGNDNRFVSAEQEEFSHPFIFGIDDALIGTLAGPVLQVLPQLLTAVNQQKLQKQAQNNKLITDLLADTNKRRILEQLLQSQSEQANAAKAQLAALLQQASDAQFNPWPETAKASSLSIDSSDYPYMSASLSTSTVVSFETGNLSDWSGLKRTVYSKNNPVTLRIKLNAPEPAPKSPLPKAIITFYFKEAEGAKPLMEKKFRQKNVAAGTMLSFSFSKEEIAVLPLNTNLMVFTEIRWLNKNGKEIKALGSTEIVFAGNYFLKEQGKPASEERELTDMKTYRAFWNKIWESPLLDSINQKNPDQKKYMWELDATLKYDFRLTANHDSNGLMPTKMLKGADDKESLTDKQEGRMKGGLEISMDELNKLCTLWDKQPVLPGEKLDPLKNAMFMKNNASECIYHAKLKGKASQRGMIWVGPVLKLFSCKLNKVKTINESGVVTEVEEETIQFPLPVSARIIGIKSN
ncbi:MAG TPA: hypothetical protein VK179_15705 [Bacteroidales bacterium]|nr:hypothetical protein [Bacteroidales bacterium]